MNWEDYMSADEAARQLGIHQNNVLKALREGWLPGGKVGGRWIIRRADVADYGERTKRRKGRSGAGREG